MSGGHGEGMNQLWTQAFLVVGHGGLKNIRNEATAEVVRGVARGRGGGRTLCRLTAGEAS